MSFTLALVLKTTAVLSIATLLCALLGKASASVRHAVWALCFAAVCAIPLVAWTVPSMEVPLLPPSSTPTISIPLPSVSIAAEVVEVVPVSLRLPLPVPSSSTSGPGQQWEWRFLIGILWWSGAVATLIRILSGIRQARRVIAQSVVCTNAGWNEAFADVCHQSRVVQVVGLRVGPDAIPPFTAGILRPLILLPGNASSWSDERLRLVLAHELAHVKRRDGLIQVLVQWATVLYWFNPLVWFAAHRLRMERERACDDRVLALGIDASDYADHLLQIARTLNAGYSVPALGMAHPSQLQQRLEALLDDNLKRRRLSPGATLAVALATATLTVVGAAVQITSMPLLALPVSPAQQGPSRSQTIRIATEKGVVSGAIRDHEGKATAGLRVAAIAVPEPGEPSAPSEMVSFAETDAEGRYRLEDIPPGRYYITAGLINYPTYYPGTIEARAARVVDVAGNNETKAIDFQMQRPAGVVVRGRLVGLQSASGARVGLIAEVTGIPFVAQSTVDGTFEFSKVPPSRYIVHAEGFRPFDVNVAEKDVNVDLVPEIVEAGVQVSGRVTGYFGGPSPPRVVVITPSAGPSAGVGGGAGIGGVGGSRSGLSPQPISSADGSFSFSKVPPGRYTVRPIPSYAAVTIDVQEKDVAGVEIVNPFYIQLEGRVTGLDSQMGAIVQVQANSLSRPGSPLTAVMQPDGAFRLQLVEGEYRVTAAGLPAGSSLKSVRFGSNDVTDAMLRIEPGMANAELLVTLDSVPYASIPGVKVSGQVQGFPGAIVILNENRPGGASLTTQTRSDSAFEFPKVQPGTYSITARVPGSSLATITVADKDVAGVHVSGVQILPGRSSTIAGGVEVTGRVSALDEGGRAMPGLPTGIQIRFDEPGGGYKWMTLERDGSFRAQLREMEQKISLANLPPGYSVESIRAGSRNLLTSSLIVDAKATRADIDIVLRYNRK